MTLYFREAFTSRILPHCRITFDKNIRCFQYDLKNLDNLNNNNNLVINPKYITRIQIYKLFTNFCI